MAAPIRVEGLGAEDAADLVQALAVRGLTAHTLAEGTAIELVEPHEDTLRLVADVAEALRDWARDRGRRGLSLRVGDGELVDVLREELQATLRAAGHRAARRAAPSP